MAVALFSAVAFLSIGFTLHCMKIDRQGFALAFHLLSIAATALAVHHGVPR